MYGSVAAAAVPRSHIATPVVLIAIMHGAGIVPFPRFRSDEPMINTKHLAELWKRRKSAGSMHEFVKKKWRYLSRCQLSESGGTGCSSLPMSWVGKRYGPMLRAQRIGCIVVI